MCFGVLRAFRANCLSSGLRSPNPPSPNTWPRSVARLVRAGARSCATMSPHIAAMDLFVVPTISFIQLYVLVIVRLTRRELVWINVTRHPTAEWIAQQITEAFPWNEAPRYLIRDQDAIYGAAVTRRGDAPARCPSSDFLRQGAVAN
jgi:hypothetical protein